MEKEADNISEDNLMIKAKKSKERSKKLLPIRKNESELIIKGDEYFYTATEEDEEDSNGEKNLNISLINKDISNHNNQKSFVQNDNNKMFDPLYISKRTQMPVPKKKLSFNPWSILKDAIGKDLNRFAVPVFLNEPISMLQKICENFQYADLLNNGAKEQNPYIRLSLAAAFCIGGLTMNTHRSAKYFNPLLGETFEYVDNDLHYRYISEQVSHHPAISACHAEGNGWTFYTNSNSSSKFTISGSLEVENIGRSYITFDNYKEQIFFTKPKIVAKNLVFGDITIDIFGKIYLGNNSGDSCEVELIPMTGTKQGVLKGEAKDIYGNVKVKIEGNWKDKIEIINQETKKRKVIWNFIDGKDEESYYFPPITFNLNNLTDELKEALPHTDSRFRPDQRLMELQDMEKAAKEKERLEEKQRKAKKERDKGGVVYKPLYFEETYDDVTGELIYLYKGEYWEDRKNKNFAKFPNIFN